jgi:catechol 2,3-dioxygenase-like lactoylglutathione lyase family enzyme
LLSVREPEFQELVQQALDGLPDEYARLISNVAVVVEDEPSPDLLADLEMEEDEDLLGLYQGLSIDHESFFQAGGQAVVLWGREKVAEDVGIADDGSGFGAIALAQNVRSREEVDGAIAAARSAGATVTKEPAETFYGGYAGYFLDPDGHAWEVAHNPGFTLEADGSLTLPDFDAP